MNNQSHTDWFPFQNPKVWRPLSSASGRGQGRLGLGGLSRQATTFYLPSYLDLRPRGYGITFSPFLKRRRTP